MKDAKDFLQAVKVQVYNQYTGLDAPDQFKALAGKVVLDEKAVASVMAVTEVKVADDVVKGETLWQTQKAILLKFLESWKPPTIPPKEIDPKALGEGKPL